MSPTSAVRLALTGACLFVASIAFPATAQAQPRQPNGTAPSTCASPNLKAGCAWFSAFLARDAWIRGSRDPLKTMRVADSLQWFDHTRHSLAFSGTFFPIMFERANVLWDPAHRLLASFTRNCGGSTGTIQRYAGKPPVSVERADLSTVRTKQGLKIGSTGEQIYALLGAPTIVSDPRSQKRVSYRYNSPAKDCGTDNTVPGSMGLNFILESDRVVLIKEDHSCG